MIPGMQELRLGPLGLLICAVQVSIDPMELITGISTE